MPNVAALTAELYNQWKWPKRWIWTVRRIRYPQFKIIPKVLEITDRIARDAELFMLTHEIGHILIESKIGPQPQSKGNVEQDAVTIGLRLLLKYAY